MTATEAVNANISRKFADLPVQFGNGLRVKPVVTVDEQNVFAVCPFETGRLPGRRQAAVGLGNDCDAAVLRGVLI